MRSRMQPTASAPRSSGDPRQPPSDLDAALDVARNEMRGAVRPERRRDSHQRHQPLDADLAEAEARVLETAAYSPTRRSPSGTSGRPRQGAGRAPRPGHAEGQVGRRLRRRAPRRPSWTPHSPRPDQRWPPSTKQVGRDQHPERPRRAGRPRGDPPPSAIRPPWPPSASPPEPLGRFRRQRRRRLARSTRQECAASSSPELRQLLRGLRHRPLGSLQSSGRQVARCALEPETARARPPRRAAPPAPASPWAPEEIRSTPHPRAVFKRRSRSRWFQASSTR